MEVSLVIKVTFGGISRRFREGVDENGNLAVDMIGLKARIFKLFHISPGTNVSITYVDDGNDVMNLIDDGDLREALAQDLKCLEITVVNNERVEQDAQQWPNELVQALQQNVPRGKIENGEDEDGGHGTTTPPLNAGGDESWVQRLKDLFWFRCQNITVTIWMDLITYLLKHIKLPSRIQKALKHLYLILKDCYLSSSTCYTPSAQW